MRVSGLHLRSFSHHFSGEKLYYLELLDFVEDEEVGKNNFLLTLVRVWQTQFVGNHLNVFYKICLE